MVNKVVSIFLYIKKMSKQNPRWRYSDKLALIQMALFLSLEFMGRLALFMWGVVFLEVPKWGLYIICKPSNRFKAGLLSRIS